MRRLEILFSFLSIFLCCEENVLYNCTAEEVPAIEVEVRDALTGDPAAEGVVGYVLEGTYVDTLRVTSWTGSVPLVMSAAYERSGKYIVVLKKPGYKDWIVSDVRVPQGDCHVDTAELIARLEKL